MYCNQCGMNMHVSKSRFFIEELIFAQLVKTFSSLMKTKDSMPCSQQSIVGPYPELSIYVHFVLY
jgi:hypothetical protein